MQTAQDLTAQFRQQETLAVETAVPAHMLFLMMEQCAKAGWELRKDVHHFLNIAATVPLAKLDGFTAKRVARRVDDIARSLLNSLSPDDPRDGLYACAMFAVTLVDEGLFKDVRNQAVLVSLMLLDEIKADIPDTNGDGAVWHLREKAWRDAARQLLFRARLLGVYMGVLARN